MTDWSIQRRLMDRLRTPGRLQAWLEGPRRWIGRAIQRRQARFNGYQGELQEAGIAELYHRYLARGVVRGLAAGVAGIGLLSLISYLAITGRLSPLGLPDLGIRNLGVAAGASLAIGIVGGVVSFGAIVGMHVAAPRVKAARRRREIDGLLPYVIVLLYSLSRGNMGFSQMIDILAESRGTYGEIAAEFGRIRHDLNYFGKDQLSALQAAQERSPSERFTDFLEDLASVVESGTDFQDFMAMQTGHQLDRLRRDNEDLLQTLNTFAETYFVIMFVAPLFGLVLLVLLSFVGANTLPAIRLLVYVVIPLVTVGSIFVADRLAGTQQSVARQDIRIATETAGDDAPDDETVSRYVRSERNRAIRRGLDRPITVLKANPRLTLLLTLPLAALVLGFSLHRGAIMPSLEFFATKPILSSAAVAGILLIPAIPLSVFHELKRQREREIVKAFPSALEVISEANEIGIGLVESCDLVDRRLDGPVADELGQIYEDVQLTWDVDAAIGSMANRVNIPEITLSLKVLSEGYRSNRDLTGVLESLSEAVEYRHEVERDRARAMRLYVFILVIGVLTFLAIAYFLNTFFFPPLADVAARLGEVEAEGSFFKPTAVPLAEYRMLLFHAGLLQALGNGLLMGKLVDDRILSGLKYAIGLTVVTVVVFLAL